MILIRLKLIILMSNKLIKLIYNFYLDNKINLYIKFTDKININ